MPLVCKGRIGLYHVLMTLISKKGQSFVKLLESTNQSKIHLWACECIRTFIITGSIIRFIGSVAAELRFNYLLKYKSNEHAIVEWSERYAIVSKMMGPWPGTRFHA
jgi:hypothetical protein